MQSDEDNQLESTQQFNSNCGGALKHSREKNGLTIQDIASRLKISPKQINAIEADDFEVLPEPTIVRGFIRNYAKLLKLDAEPILDAYRKIVPEKTPYAFAVKPASTMKVSQYDKPKVGRYIWGGFIVLVGLAAWLFYYNYIQKPSPITPSQTSQPSETTEQLPQSALPAAERLEQNSTSTNNAVDSSNSANEISANSAVSAESTNVLPLPVPDNKNTTSSSGLQITQKVDSIGASAILNTAPLNTSQLNAEPSTAQPAGETSQPTESMMAVVFIANQESWVSIVNADGRKVINKTIFANSRESIEVAPPVSITVGNAAGLSMMVNNKPVDLAPHTRGNVARVKLD